MSLQDFGTMDANASLKQVVNELANLMDTLNFLLNGNLDVKNIRADSLTARVIKANSITADKLDVAQLSAITADMGTLTAGIIYGAYIATANGTYPRIEFSSVGNLLTAFFDATHYASIIPNLAGTPALKFTTPTASGYLAMGAALTLQAIGELDISATTELYLQANNYIHIVGGWGRLKNESSGNTLQADLDAKAPKGLAGVKTYYVSDTSGGAVTRKLTFTDGVLTSQT